MNKLIIYVAKLAGKFLYLIDLKALFHLMLKLSHIILLFFRSLTVVLL